MSEVEKATWIRLGKPVLLAALALYMLAFATGLPDALAGRKRATIEERAVAFGAPQYDAFVFLEAGQRMREGGAKLYAQPEDVDNVVGIYIYPPFFASVCALATLVPRPAALWAYGLAQVAAFFAMALVLAGLFGFKGEARRDFLFATAAVAFMPALSDISLGNINILLFLLIALGLLAMERRRDLLGGSLLGAAALIKVIPGVLLIALLLQRRYKAALAMVVAALALQLVPLVWLVPKLGVSEGLLRNGDLTRQYIAEIALPRALKQSAENVGESYYPNVSISGVAQRLFRQGAPIVRVHYEDDWWPEKGPLWFALDDGVLRVVGVALALGLFAAGCFGCARAEKSAQGRVAGAMLVLLPAMLGNLLCWDHHLVALALLFAPLAAWYIGEGRGKALYYAAGFALFLLCNLLFLQKDALVYLVILGVPTLGIAFAWGTLLWSSVRKPPPQNPPAAVS